MILWCVAVIRSVIEGSLFGVWQAVVMGSGERNVGRDGVRGED